MSERPDGELVELARRGDRAASGELFSRYWRAARAAAFGVTGEFASAEDAAAEAFQHALVGMASLRDPDRFGPWLRTIVRRKARLTLARRHAAMDAAPAELPTSGELPDDALAQLELEALVRRAMRELPDRLREAMALIYFEGYNPPEAAKFLAIPAGTLRRRLHDGRARLHTAVEQILQRKRPMKEERERELDRLKTMIGNGEVYEALRESLSLRPPPTRELIGLFVPPRTAAPGGLQFGHIREFMRSLSRPSNRVSDPAHPVGSMVAAVRSALPDFQDWDYDGSGAAARFLAASDKERDRLLAAALPPGFAEGRPGAFLRCTRTMVRLDGSGRVLNMYEHLLASPGKAAFREGMRDDARLSDALILAWMVSGPLELRSVQELLERLASAVLPGVRTRFSSYDEPRYRSALQLEVGDAPARAACGGVLAEWPGQPDGATAAQVLLFLEPWASAASGRTVEFDPLPPIPRRGEPS